MRKSQFGTHGIKEPQNGKEVEITLVKLANPFLFFALRQVLGAGGTIRGGTRSTRTSSSRSGFYGVCPGAVAQWVV